MTTVVARALKTPARHTCCGKRRAARAPVPHAERREDASCSIPCPLAAPAPRQRLTQAGCRVTPTSRGSTVSSVARLLRVFHRLPTGSFSSSQSHGPQGRPRRAPVPQSRDHLTVSAIAFGDGGTPPPAASSSRALPFHSSCVTAATSCLRLGVYLRLPGTLDRMSCNAHDDR